MMKTKDPYAILRWTARISGLLIVVFTLIFVIGSAFEDRNRHPGAPFLSGLTPLVLIIFCVWGLGLAGLILGWWKEKLGGFLSLSCFILVFILNLFNVQSPDRMGALVPMLISGIPSVLFICYGWLTKKKQGFTP